MNLVRSTNKAARGFTILELFVVVAVVAGFLSVFIPAWISSRARSERKLCVNNLRQTGLACMLWDCEHAGDFPMAVSQTNGGTMEFTSGPYAFRHFQVMSNEMLTPKFAFCPADSDRKRFVVNDFAEFNNSNLSYFIGAVSNDTDPSMLLSGDRNISNGMPINNGLLKLTPRQPGDWTDDLHKNAGNILLADGSVQEDNNEALRHLVTSQITLVSGSATLTNIAFAQTSLQMPVLGR